ncbi:hypothetical protein [Nocardioides convexus]|uniref:hypothetical protein n=1 Tax=Nocardioides convexus TaxID=2712224 RepID=UPI0024186108|nr:hypothetical protein [Nocardioides convexus]
MSLIDNVADMAHFYYVHFAFPTSFRNIFDGHTATQFMESKGRPDTAGGGYGDENSTLKSVATYYGPAYMINWLEVDYKGFVTEVILINCHIPTGPSSFRLQYGISVRKPEGLDEKTCAYIAERYTESFGDGFLQDVAIWENKVAVQNPLLCEEDGPVYQPAPLVRAVLRRRRRHQGGDDRPLRVRGRHHQGQRVLARRGRREPGPDGRRRRDRRALSHGLLRPAQPGDPRGPAPLHRGPPGRGRLPRLPGPGQGEEEQRPPDLRAVERGGPGGVPGVRPPRRRSRPSGRAQAVLAADG